jgi:CarboxypepD_reg-like domain/TonB-dependent Receptor Plug Domain
MTHNSKSYFLGVLLYLMSSWAMAQSKVNLNGYVKDAATGESLIGASVKIKGLSIGNVSNVYGYYSISLLPGKYVVSCSYIGYDAIEDTLDIKTAIKRNFELKESGKNTTAEVKISATRPQDNVKSMEMSVNKLDIKSISKIPALLGEVDVIRSIQLLPGVSTVGEGATGFNVRGGNIDNNLVLQDEAPVYNSSHLFGFFSVFNPDAVKDVKLIKGGIPAQYGGRTSSLLDVRMKEGNSKQPAIQGGLGLIFSRLTIEAPIVKDKASFIVAGRRSYGDVFLKFSGNDDLKNTIAYFYDFSAKANYEISNRDKVFVSGYFGRDRFGFSGAGGFSWGNATASMRWNHVFNDKLFLNATAFFSQYDYALEFERNGGESSFKWNSNIVNYSVKPEFSWFANNENTITFGGQTILYNFLPGKASAVSNGDPTSFGLPNQFALESGLYIANEQKVSSRFSLQYGLRYSFFQYMGEGKSYVLGDTTPGIRKPILETKDYTY